MHSPQLHFFHSVAKAYHCQVGFGYHDWGPYPLPTTSSFRDPTWREKEKHRERPNTRPQPKMRKAFQKGIHSGQEGHPQWSGRASTVVRNKSPTAQEWCLAGPSKVITFESLQRMSICESRHCFTKVSRYLSAWPGPPLWMWLSLLLWWLHSPTKKCSIEQKMPMLSKVFECPTACRRFE